MKIVLSILVTLLFIKTLGERTYVCNNEFLQDRYFGRISRDTQCIIHEDEKINKTHLISLNYSLWKHSGIKKPSRSNDSPNNNIEPQMVDDEYSNEVESVFGNSYEQYYRNVMANEKDTTFTSSKHTPGLIPFISEQFPHDKILINISFSNSTVDELYSGPVQQIPKTIKDRLYGESWVFLFHGMGRPDQFDRLENIKTRPNTNIVVLDYSVGTVGLINYVNCVINLSKLVKFLHESVWNVLSPDPSKVTFIGHSFGSHVAGYLGTQVFPEKTIVLDPAMPLFDQMSISQFNVHSGKHTLAIHTSLFWGSTNNIASTDLIVNNPHRIYKECNDWVFRCNHAKSVQFFADIIGKSIMTYKDQSTTSSVMSFNNIFEKYNIFSGRYRTYRHAGDYDNTFHPIYYYESS